MGRDKALLEIEGMTLVERVASRVEVAAGSATIVAPPHRYRRLRFPVVADLVQDCGPLGGVFTALSITGAEWNAIVACDMPSLTSELLETLFLEAEPAGPLIDAVIAESARGLDPLCAVYRRRSRELARRAIDQKIFKMHDFVSTLRIRRLVLENPAPLENINTPAEWSAR